MLLPLIVWTLNIFILKVFEDSTEVLVDEGATNVEQKGIHSDEHDIRHSDDIYAVSTNQPTALPGANRNPVSKMSCSMQAANELAKSGMW